MWAWVNHLKIQPRKISEFRRMYGNEIVPALSAQKGTINLFLIELTGRGDEFVSLVLWGDKNDAKRYKKSGLFDEMTLKLQPILAEPAKGRSYELPTSFSGRNPGAMSLMATPNGRFSGTL